MFRSRFLLPWYSVVLCVLSTACSTLPARERAFDPALCNRGAAYEAGFNDGLDGRAMGSGFLDTCREDLRAQGQEGYRSGYASGLQRLQERTKALSPERSDEQSRAQPPTPPPALNGNGGIQINIGNGGNNPKAWYCSVQAFTSSFDSFGPTQLEARQLTIQSCIRQYNPMHCQEVKCQLNQ